MRDRSRRVLRGLRAGLALSFVAELLGGCRGAVFCPRGTHPLGAPASEVAGADLRICTNDDPHASSFLFVVGTDGRKREQCPFVGTAWDGPYLAWHANGTLFLRGFYRDGRQQGQWEQWSAAGARVAEGAYRDGELVSGAPVGAVASCARRTLPPR